MSQRRVYTDQFKQEVMLYLDAHPELSHRKIADSFGLRSEIVSRWNRERKSSNDSPSQITDEVRAQQLEVARLREENEILKKALAIFSKQKR